MKFRRGNGTGQTGQEFDFWLDAALGSFAGCFYAHGLDALQYMSKINTCTSKINE